MIDFQWQTIYFSDFSNEKDRYFSYLSLDEKDRSARFLIDEKKTEYMLTRGYLREWLGKMIHIAPEKIVFSYEQLGKPYLTDHAVFFNASHTHEMAAFAASQKYPIGIDIELIDEKKVDVHLVAPFCFSESEYYEFMQFSETEKPKRFFQLWTLKEAIAKALGKGMGHYLKKFDIGFQYPTDLTQFTYQNFYLQQKQLEQHYLAIVLKKD